jgi:hypothetical protein
MNAIKIEERRMKALEDAGARNRSRVIAASKGIKAGERLKVIAFKGDVVGVIGSVHPVDVDDATDIVLLPGETVMAVDDEEYFPNRGSMGIMVVRVLSASGIRWVHSRDVARPGDP